MQAPSVRQAPWRELDCACGDVLRGHFHERGAGVEQHPVASNADDGADGLVDYRQHVEPDWPDGAGVVEYHDVAELDVLEVVDAQAHGRSPLRAAISASAAASASASWRRNVAMVLSCSAMRRLASRRRAISRLSREKGTVGCWETVAIVG